MTDSTNSPLDEFEDEPEMTIVPTSITLEQLFKVAEQNPAFSEEGEDVDAAIEDELGSMAYVLHDPAYLNDTAADFCARTFKDKNGEFQVGLDELRNIFLVEFDDTAPLPAVIADNVTDTSKNIKTILD